MIARDPGSRRRRVDHGADRAAVLLHDGKPGYRCLALGCAPLVRGPAGLQQPNLETLKGKSAEDGNTAPLRLPQPKDDAGFEFPASGRRLPLGGGRGLFNRNLGSFRPVSAA